MRRAVDFGILVLIFLICSITQAQESADAAVGTGLDLTLTALYAGGGLIVGALGWLGKKLIDYINVKIKNEWVRGALSRLIGSVHDAVAMVNQTAKKKLKAAKDPSSPGGTSITEGEAKELGDAVWSALKSEYGGWDGLFSVIKKIGIGDESAAKAKVDTMIEAAVHGQKLATKSTESRGPG